MSGNIEIMPGMRDMMQSLDKGEPNGEKKEGKEEPGKAKEGNGDREMDAIGPPDPEIRNPIEDNGKDPGGPKEGVPS